MKLDLRGVEDFPAKVRIQVRPGEMKPFGPDVVGVGAVEVELAIQKSGEEYFCQGQATARATLRCARCLVEFSTELNSATDFVVCSETLAAQRAGVIDEEIHVFLTGDGLQANITEPVQQALALALPLKPLCSEECKGLCQSCGANLNTEPCSCEDRKTDARWEALRELIDRDNKKDDRG